MSMCPLGRELIHMTETTPQKDENGLWIIPEHIKQYIEDREAEVYHLKQNLSLEVAAHKATKAEYLKFQYEVEGQG